MFSTLWWWYRAQNQRLQLEVKIATSLQNSLLHQVRYTHRTLWGIRLFVFQGNLGRVRWWVRVNRYEEACLP